MVVVAGEYDHEAMYDVVPRFLRLMSAQKKVCVQQFAQGLERPIRVKTTPDQCVRGAAIRKILLRGLTRQDRQIESG